MLHEWGKIIRKSCGKLRFSDNVKSIQHHGESSQVEVCSTAVMAHKVNVAAKMLNLSIPVLCISSPTNMMCFLYLMRDLFSTIDLGCPEIMNSLHESQTKLLQTCFLLPDDTLALISIFTYVLS